MPQTARVSRVEDIIMLLKWLAQAQARGRAAGGTEFSSPESAVVV